MRSLKCCRILFFVQIFEKLSIYALFENLKSIIIIITILRTKFFFNMYLKQLLYFLYSLSKHLYK